MNNFDKRKLKYLKKANQLKLILPKYFKPLLSIEPKLEHAKILKGEQIEQMIIEINSTNREVVVFKRTRKNCPLEISNTLKSLSSHLNKVNYFSINKLQELWFAELETTFVIENFENILEIDGDLLVVHDKGLKNGLWVDVNEEYWTTDGKTNYEWVYELKIWGAEWTKQTMNYLID